MNWTNETGNVIYYDDYMYGSVNSHYPALKHAWHMVAVYSLAYGIIFILAVVGNILVVTVVCKNPVMHNVTNYFIVSLALSDLLVAILCMPLTLLANIFTGWPWGAFACKAVPYLQGVSVFASVNTLAAIAVDRYLAICYTWQPIITTRKCRLIIFGIWTVSLLIMTPQAHFYTLYVQYGVPMCHQLWPDYNSQRAYFVVALFMCCYFLPLVFILICYILIAIRVWRRKAPGIANDRGVIYRSKIKVLRMLAVIISVFALSWLPLYCVYFRMYFSDKLNDKEIDLIFNILLPVSQWLGLSNSGMNPIIYRFFSRKYRRAFRSVLVCCNFIRHRGNRQNSHTASTRCQAVNHSLALERRRSYPQRDNKSHVRTYSPNKNISINYNSHGHITVSYRRDHIDGNNSNAM